MKDSLKDIVDEYRRAYGACDDCGGIDFNFTNQRFENGAYWFTVRCNFCYADWEDFLNE